MLESEPVREHTAFGVSHQEDTVRVDGILVGHVVDGGKDEIAADLLLLPLDLLAASGAVAFEEVGEQTLKGKTAPVPAWRAVRVVGDQLVRINRDDTTLTVLASDGLDGPASLAFGTGKGDRQSVFISNFALISNENPGIVKVDVGVPGMPLP